MRVWRASLDRSPQVVAQLEANLSSDERERASRYRFSRDKRRFTTRRGVLRRILADCVDASPAELTFCRDETGKPRLSGAFAHSQLYFNVSHSHELALITVSRDRQVGVDVEWVRPIAELDSIAERYLPAADVTQLRLAPGPERAELFFRGWTRLEAELKAIGVGLGTPRGEEPAGCTVRDLTPTAGYVGAVAAEGTDWVLDAYSEEQRITRSRNQSAQMHPSGTPGVPTAARCSSRDIVGHGKKGEIPVKGQDEPDRVARVEEGDA